ncbi:MAG: hypothetical protein R2693_07065 [Nocardioidaceae bacterium]
MQVESAVGVAGGAVHDDRDRDLFAGLEAFSGQSACLHPHRWLSVVGTAFVTDWLRVRSRGLRFGGVDVGEDLAVGFVDLDAQR